ncbi:uncharacterized protein ASPGLDRAFT_751170 [Aspergillus glaucus CBS 516.65]|uniref:Uncharacterized protein n=1 Tax=Aspergillus glaucus CBS 516.65 TaxID=1160497 RepID=A0A1L9VY67_ASPGL|nr:hypothetical protein ASPGLDRAFT_751170 [Aspergillus glaucus CBS 516.65]OJJ88864.1 hypothetical protein ASPGLDRAFT_751170 [Aspergillus glaucus CBS 516.65]
MLPAKGGSASGWRRSLPGPEERLLMMLSLGLQISAPPSGGSPLELLFAFLFEIQFSFCFYLQSHASWRLKRRFH